MSDLPPRITVVIPALDEADSVGKVVEAIPRWVDRVIVVDNGSTDGTGAVAEAAGAEVVSEPRRGYGRACLRGIEALGHVDVVVFMDADYSDDPTEMPGLIDPILAGEADLVIGSRAVGEVERGALTPQQRFGNALACFLMRRLHGVRYTDLGPFRAISARGLRRLGMDDENFGWTIQMQLRAAMHRLAHLEIPASYRRRIGRSKISGTVRGVVGAGTKIIATVFNEMRPAVRRRHTREPSAPERLIVFSRYPVPGRAKTRLIPALGEEGAADLHRQMAEHTLAHARRYARLRHCEVQVWHAGADEAAMRQWLGEGPAYHAQPPGDLGARLAAAARAAGGTRQVFIGADCPGVTDGVLRAAFEALDDDDVVLGPATDGGYYLIGLRAGNPLPFRDVPWGTADVLETTKHRCAELGLTVALLETMSDVDRPEDLKVWHAARRRPASHPAMTPNRAAV